MVFGRIGRPIAQCFSDFSACGGATKLVDLIPNERQNLLLAKSEAFHIVVFCGNAVIVYSEIAFANIT